MILEDWSHVPSYQFWNVYNASASITPLSEDIYGSIKTYLHLIVALNDITHRIINDLLTEFPVSDEITASFRRFGHLFVDWPHKAESKSYFPPKGELNREKMIFVPVGGDKSILMGLIAFVLYIQPFQDMHSCCSRTRALFRLWLMPAFRRMASFICVSPAPPSKTSL